jgi:hypothetical protein
MTVGRLGRWVGWAGCLRARDVYIPYSSFILIYIYINLNITYPSYPYQDELWNTALARVRSSGTGRRAAPGRDALPPRADARRRRASRFSSLFLPSTSLIFSFPFSFSYPNRERREISVSLRQQRQLRCHPVQRDGSSLARPKRLSDDSHRHVCFRGPSFYMASPVLP